MANFARTSTLMKKIPHNNSNVRNSMVLVWYWELLRAQSYKLIWGGELDLSPPKLDSFFIKNRKKLKDESGIWTRALKDKHMLKPALYQLSHRVLVHVMVWYKYLFLCAMSGSNLGVSIILVKFTKSAIC